MPKIEIDLGNSQEYQQFMNDKRVHKKFRIRKKYFKRKMLEILNLLLGGRIEKL